MKSTLILALLLKIFILRTVNSRRPVLKTNSESKDDSKIEPTTPRLDSKLALNTIRNFQSIKIDLPPKTTEMKRRTFRVPELSSKAITENNTTEKTTSLLEIVTSKPQSALLQEISTTEFTSTQGQVDSLTNQTPESSETTTEHEAVEETTFLHEITTTEFTSIKGHIKTSTNQPPESSETTTVHEAVEETTLLQEITTTKFTSTKEQLETSTNQTSESSETTTEHEAVEETTTFQEKTTPELHALQIGLIAFIIMFITITVGHCYYKRKNGTIDYKYTAKNFYWEV